MIALLLTSREDCRFHGNEITAISDGTADTAQELLRLFSRVKNEHDINLLQKGTTLDDTLPEVQKFIESRSMQVQLYMYLSLRDSKLTQRYASIKCAISLILEKTLAHRKYRKVLMELHKDSRSVWPRIANSSVKAIGFYSPYGSYWIALSLTDDGQDVDLIEPFVKHVESWSKQHNSLKPRALHLRAELACRSNIAEVYHSEMVHHLHKGRLLF